MAGKSCFGCGMAKSADVHSRHYQGSDGHPYISNAEPGLKPMSEGMRNFRRDSGYDAAVKAAKGSPCQVVSPVCTGFAEHLHEPLSRGRSGGLQKAVELGGTIPACDPCNGYISENPTWAYERGFLHRNTEEGRQAAREAKEARESAASEAAPSPVRRSRLR